SSAPRRGRRIAGLTATDPRARSAVRGFPDCRRTRTGARLEHRHPVIGWCRTGLKSQDRNEGSEMRILSLTVGRVRSVLSIAALVTAPTFVVHAVALAQTNELWSTDGTVLSIARDGGTIYIAGSFTQVGPATGSAVAIDAIMGTALQPFPKVEGIVY